MRAWLDLSLFILAVCAVLYLCLQRAPVTIPGLRFGETSKTQIDGADGDNGHWKARLVRLKQG